MSFLLGRTASRQQQPRGSPSVLYDADDGQDELEAAFGEADAYELDGRADYRDPASRPAAGQSAQAVRPPVELRGYRPDGQHQGDDSAVEESDFLLHNRSNSELSQASGSRSQSPGHSRPATSSTSTRENERSQTTGSNAGGYDFEADPYERRSAPISLGNDDDDEDDDNAEHNSQIPSSRRPDRRNGGGLLATLRNALPARFRQYDMLNPNGTRSTSGRRTDGTTDHGDDDDEGEWIAPPPSMPGLYGGGTRNDGVFSNMAVKPGQANRERADVVGGDDENPEKEIPPAYEMAVLDAAPPYFDTTVHAPGGGVSGLASVTGGLDEILIEGLPLGNPFSFFWSLLVSMSFQFVGFLLTTMLSTSHAAKNGSRAGLGVTLIQYGLYLGAQGEEMYADDSAQTGGDAGQDEWSLFWGGNGGDDATPTASRVARSVATGAVSLFARAANETADDQWPQPVLMDGQAAVSGVAGSWLSMVLMIGGWFLLVSSLTSYLKAIRYAKALRDGASTNTDSWLEQGGPLGQLYTRVTGRDFPIRQQERTWGLAPRRAPTVSAAEASPPSTAEPTPGTAGASLITPRATGVRFGI